MEFLLGYALEMLEFARIYFISLVIGYLSLLGPGLFVIPKEC